ncbi:uncharacterized protein LOC108914972 [Anoplophora glabripennis]|uniref:uncharacterized protein LOC108914972 n=1 Tax=Anoplophora glabripennis TaxID=217634 RepID=UPI000874FB39|nr:uncharacterized protein LOC108914972 [Anoplophora glabripennis]
MLFYIFLTTVGISLASTVDYEDYGILGPPIYFEKSVYRAKVVDRAIELLDGPITLQNCYPYNFNVVAIADEGKYFTVPDIGPGCNYNCSICFSAFVRENVNPSEVLYDTITLEVHSEFYGISSTTIIIVYSSEYDPYKLVYNINGTEYVILNYFYFKIFLFIIIVTGILLLVLEIREIILKHKDKEYAPVNDEVNYI